MNSIRSWIGAGSDKKVIILGPSTTLNYLKLQLFDIIHDSPAQNETSKLNLAYQIAFMQALWIATNNSSASLDIAKLATVLYNNASNDIAHYITYPIDTLPPDANFTILADTCDGNISIGPFCKNVNRRIISQASIYDNGAYGTNCGSREYRQMNITPPKFLTISNEYYNDKSVKKSFNAATKVACKNSGKTINNAYDTAIIGNIGGVNVVIALMNAVAISDCIYFEHVAEPGFIVQRGYSPSVSNLSILHKHIKTLGKINSQNISTTDYLLMYTELVAKHWGDLCMVTDIMGTSTYLLTNDTMVKRLCNEFGLNFSDGVNLYQRKTPVGYHVIFEVNSGSIFNR